MSDIVLRRLVGTALIMLLAYQVGMVIASLASTTLGGVTAAAVAVITFVSARRANVDLGNRLWFLVPTVLFTLLPLALKVWRLAAGDSGWVEWIVGLTPLLIGFVLPVSLLWLAYAELRRRTLMAVAAGASIVWL